MFDSMKHERNESKNILVYLPSFKNSHPTLRRISVEIAEAFKALGRNVICVDIGDSYDVRALEAVFGMMHDGEVDFSIGINALPSVLTDNNNVSIYKDLDVPYVSIMLDAPYNKHIDKIGFECKKHLVCMLDKSHLSLLDMIYPEKKFWGKMFLPLGGISEAREEELFSSDRKYDVVFASNNYYTSFDELPWNIDTCNKDIKIILNEVLEYLLENTISINDGVKYVLNYHGLCCDEFYRKLLPFYSNMLMYIKGQRRIKALEFLGKNDIAIDVFGTGWENDNIVKKYVGKNIKLHGGVSYQEILNATVQAKIVYQDQAEFNNGGHDRVFTSMLNGAVVVTEYSSYLAREFVEDEDIFFYDWKKGINMVKIINELLIDESKRLSVAISAYGKADKRHRWINRGKSILEAIEILRLGDC